MQIPTRNRRSFLTFILTLTLGLLGFNGCRGPAGYITQTEKPDRYVRVEAQSHGERVGESSFTHPVGSFLPTNTDPEPPLWRDNEKRPVQILGGAQQVRALLVHYQRPRPQETEPIALLARTEAAEISLDIPFSLDRTRERTVRPLSTIFELDLRKIQ